MTAKPKVLTVDDRPENLMLLDRLLRFLGVEVYAADNGTKALAFSLEHDFCLAIVDVQMPGMDGYELVERLRANEKTATLPVIFISAILTDEYYHRKAYDTGAVDFMSKPFIPEVLLSKVQVFIDLYNQRRRLQDTVDELNEANAALSRRALQLETSSQVSRKITSLLKLDELLPQVTRLIGEAFSYGFVGIWLPEESTGSLKLAAHQSRAEGAALQAETARNIVRDVLRSGTLYLDNQLICDSPQSAGEYLPEVRAELVLPLKFGDDLLGVLDIQSQNANEFAGDDVTTLQGVADQVAVAIRNARLYAEVIRLNENLEELVAQRTAELQAAYNRLEKMDKNKSDFIAVAAHELRTPLTMIRGYTEMLRDQTPPHAAPMLDGILSGQNRLLEVVNSMLDVSRLDNETVKMITEPVLLREIIGDICTGLGRALEERSINLTMTGLKGLPIIEADPDLLNKLFTQLIINAIKYTPDGGRITIEGKTIEATQRGGRLIVEDQSFDAPPALSVDDIPNQFVQIAIQDTGIGIDAQYIELIFEKFFQLGAVQFHSSGRTKFKGGGPGLGLAIARGIAQMHGGRVWAESPGYDEEKCPGSTFYVLLPVKKL